MRAGATHRMRWRFVPILWLGLLGGMREAQAQAPVPSPPSPPALPPVGLIIPVALPSTLPESLPNRLPPSTMSPQATPPSLLPPTHLPPWNPAQPAPQPDEGNAPKELPVSTGPLTAPTLPSTPISVPASSLAASSLPAIEPIPTLPILPATPRLGGPVREMPILALPGPNMPAGVPTPMPAPASVPTPAPTPKAPPTPSATAVLTLPQGLPDCLCPPETPTPRPAEAAPFRAYWDHGLYFTTPEQDFLIHFGGTMQYDSAWYTAQPSLTSFPGGTGPFRDGTTPRRLRLRSDGTVYENLEYYLEVEFINGFTTGAQPGTVIRDGEVPTIPSLTDGHLTQNDVPWLGNIRIGNQKEPFSLEHLDSDRFLPFMERSYLFDFTYVSQFNNGFSPGISAFNTWADGRVFTHGGVYKNLPDPFPFGLGDGEYAVTGRIGILPIWNQEEQRYWYIGGAMSRRDPIDDVVAVRVRNLIRNAPGPLLNILATTGAVPAESNGLFNLESAFVSGPLTVVGEYQSNQLYGASTTDGVPQGTVNYNGFYLSTLYFLTGETRTWNTRSYVFNRVVPKSNFLVDKDTHAVEGWGAWELGARYSYLDLNDKAIRGGRLQSVTLGLNWYLNPITKLQFNYDCAYKDQGINPLAKGLVHAFGTRFYFDF